MEEEVSAILVAAHELKAPLSTLRQLALAIEGDTPKNTHLQDEMVCVTDRAIRQVNDLMKIKKLRDGLFEMEPGAVRAVCDDVTRELNYLFRINHRSLFVKYCNRSRLVTANKELLRSVVYNFLLNAMHYSGDEVSADLIVKETGGRVKIEIRDYGPALPMDVWREMKRGWINKPTSIAMRPGSSGLGLYIASKFSRYMNADVGAVRHRDGTSFYVSLPVSRQMSLWDV